MEHIGIDLGASRSHIAILDGTGTRVAHRVVPTAELPQWLGRRNPGRVVMEACTQSPSVARAAQAAKHEAHVLPGSLVRAVGIGRRGIKTDERDALVLAEASHRIQDLPSVHLRSELSAELRRLQSSRHMLVETRKQLTSHCKSVFRGRLQRLSGRATKSFATAARTLAEEHPDGLPIGLEAVLDIWEATTAQLERLDKEIEELVAAHPHCKLMMTMPGVGPQVSLAFCTQIDDPHRFGSADALGSYLALVPGEHTTGGKVVRTGTLRAGPKYLKALLVQAAWSMWRSRPNDPLVLAARAKADRRGRRIAIVALARKMAVILWSMWKHNTTYDPLRASSYQSAE